MYTLHNLHSENFVVTMCAAHLNVKEVIETLCRLLHHHGYTKINPEIFRLAKFDKPEASLPLFELLYELLCNGTQAEDLYGDHSTNECFKYFIFLWHASKLCYPDFNRLIVNKVTKLSSQELLIFFGYFLNKTKFFVKHLANTDNILVKNTFTHTTKNSKCANHDDVSINHIIVMNKKADFALRNFMSSINHLSKLIHKCSKHEKELLLKEINRSSEKVISKLKLIDFMASNNMKLQKELEVRLEEQLILLKLHYKWTNFESYFWKWMSSVFVERQNVLPTTLTTETKYKLSLIFDNSLDFNEYIKPFKKYIPSYTKISLQKFLHKLLVQNIVTANENNTESPQCLNVDTLKYAIEDMYDTNKQWLHSILDEAFPSTIQLPAPKK